MLEITGDDIAALTDSDLRTLLGLLSEAELRKHGLSTSHARYGGHQNAADDGVDVDIELPEGSVIGGFVPRPKTSFQVKREDMPPARILAEMRPKGVLRPVIHELANDSGAYVIVSSQGSTARRALHARRKAMKHAVQGIANESSLKLEFYDRSQIATWVRDHGGLILWVREKIRKQLQGWRAYGAWAHEVDSASATYLEDEKLRVRAASQDAANGLSAANGLRRIRDLLREPRAVVRLVGLSGVGKTRFVEALFDRLVGDTPLDATLAYYTNMADDPDPQPSGLASQLIAEGRRGIFIIDNCPQDLHRRLSEVCVSANSKLSLITVDYDIREDQPEATSVFELRAASDDLIQKLIQRRFATVSKVDVQTIARFSDGNARVAIALADTVGRFDTIGTLTDDELLHRLFQQGHQHDESLFQIAQACSLVYSFEGEDVSSADEAELFRLGALIGKNALEMYRGVAELVRRELAQQRSVWRAILPQAIANRLAAGALQDIPASVIEAQFGGQESKRLLRSFSRRLGYLGKEGKNFADRWLAPGGLLGTVPVLSDLEKAMFENVAPAAPETALWALEQTLLQADENVLRQCEHYRDVIRSIAYEARLFERCAALLARMAPPIVDSNRSDRAIEILTSLFHIYFSGTLATIEQRLLTIREWYSSGSTQFRILAISGLDALLKVWHFDYLHGFDFGTQSRDYGYWPHTHTEVKNWYACALQLGEEFACSDEPSAAQALSAIAVRFRELWTGAQVYDELEHVCCAIATRRFWPDGWRAVRHTWQYDAAGFNAENRLRLAKLEELLRPRDLLQQVRSIVLSSKRLGFDVDDFDGPADFQARRINWDKKIRALGEAVAADQQIFGELLPELLLGRGNLFTFGQGLVRGAADPMHMWRRMVAQLAATPEEDINLQLLLGFLNELQDRDPELTDSILDEACGCPKLAGRFPLLQTAIRMNGRGFARVMRSLTLGKAPIQTYCSLAYNRGLNPILPTGLCMLLLEIASKPDGLESALEILAVKLHASKELGQECNQEIIAAGQELLKQFVFSTRQDGEDYRLGSILKACLVGEEGAALADEVCTRLKQAVSSFTTYEFGHDYLVEGLFVTQPAATLDGLLAGDAKDVELGLRIIHALRGDLVAIVPENTLLGWCDHDSESRYPVIGAAIMPFSSTSETTPPRWTGLALLLLQRAPDPVAVLKQFIRQFWPRSGWVGSATANLEQKVTLLDEFDRHPNPVVIEFVKGEKVRLAQKIADEKRRETTRDKQRDERFE